MFVVPHELDYCSSAILRVLYDPHKPTEDVFYQCADISVSAQNTSGIFLQAIWYDSSIGQSAFVQIDAVYGDIYVYDRSPIIRGDEGSPTRDIKFITNGLFTANGAQGISYYTEGDGVPGILPATLLAVNSKGQTSSVTTNFPFPLNFFDFDPQDQSILGVGLYPSNTTQGSFQYGIMTIDPQTAMFKILASSPPDDVFVNFLWTAIDTINQRYFILSADENAPTTLHSKLIIFNFTNWELINEMVPDYSSYTFSNIYYDSQTNRLLALSPGLLNGTLQWTLVEINTASGAVDPLFTIDESFVLNYNGNVFQVDFSSRLLYHVFDMQPSNSAQPAPVTLSSIGAINIDTGEFTHSPPSEALSVVFNVGFVAQ